MLRAQTSQHSTNDEASNGMATYGDITREKMAFLIELVNRSRRAKATQPLMGPGRLEWLLIVDEKEGALIRAGESWRDLPADRAFYQSLVRRGYLGMLASSDISSGEVVIWPTERAEGLAAWASLVKENGKVTQDR